MTAKPDRNLTIGLGLRAPHVDHILAHLPDVSWFEIISENYMAEGGRARDVLDRIRAHYPVVQHGVVLYVGSVQGLDRELLAGCAHARPPPAG